MILAQAQQAGPVFLERIMSFQPPTTQQYVEYLLTLGVLQSVLLLATGLVYLLQGWRIFKALVIVNAAVLGAMLGFKIGSLIGAPNLPLILGIAVAVLLAVLSWPLMKFAVSLMGAIAGSLLGYGLWMYCASAMGKPHLESYAWAGGLIGLITLGLLAFVIFRVVIMAFTSLQGSLLTVTGMLGLLMESQRLRETLQDELVQNVHLLPMLILLPAIIGMVFQNAGKKKPAKKE